MPYRRLPNTDQARIRALKAVVVKGDICNVYDLAVSLKALTDARNFLTKFEAAQAYYADCFERQARAGRKHQANVNLRPKDYSVCHTVPDDFFRDENWLDRTAGIFELMKPFNDFVNYTIDECE